MILLIIFSSLLIVGIIGIYSFYEFSGWHTLSQLVFMLGAIVTGCLLLFIPIVRHDVRSDIAKLSAFKETITTARQRNLDPLERAAILKDIAKWNETIASCQYNNAHIWDLWIPDEVEKLQYIK